MRKRCALVRTLIYEPDIILMDEPFGPLDAQTRVILQDELLKLWDGTGKTIVFVTHDLVEAIALSDRIVLFSRAPGRIKQVYKVPLSRPRDVFHIHAEPAFPEFFDRLWRDLKEEITEVELRAK
jgi:NitT/TauT family transport system ATP-binding protein